MPRQSYAATTEASPKKKRASFAEQEEAEEEAWRARGTLGKQVREFKWDPGGEGKEGSGHELELELEGKAKEKLLHTARIGDFQGAVHALNEGASVHSTTRRGQTALMLAASSSTESSVKVLKFLIEARADAEAKDESGWTALLYASRSNSLQGVDCILAAKASVTVRANDGKTAAMLAAMEGGEDLVMNLVEKRAQLDKKDERGWSILFFAVADGHVDLTKWLLRKQCDPKDRSKDGLTPLMVCCSCSVNQKKLAFHILKKKACLSDKDNIGNTALMMALTQGKEALAEFLLAEGTDVMIKNSSNEDAIDIAERLGMNAMKAKLEMRARLQAERRAEGD
ncbi:unnamed protein product [Polarella glacialis]|uniref:Uncharacterized protein n=1 Tax=Polarella glacialis TaxID=89957 RepID=A0A813KXM3_POLGL|nr:unnamed protein product [Polarella glacialis]